VLVDAAFGGAHQIAHAAFAWQAVTVPTRREDREELRSSVRYRWMDRLYLRGRENVHKRLLVRAAACNLGLLLRSWYGAGKPKAAHDLR
jgi:hypothetical protein